MMKKRLIRITVILILGLGIAAAVAAYQIKNEQGDFSPSKKNTDISIVAKNFGGSFTLTNQDGEIVTEKDFTGWRLIYFGFTYCPAICPTELQKMAQALNALPAEQANQVTPIFISVDPERDTVEVMKNYVTLFHPRLIGLRGNEKQTEDVKNAYKIYAAKVQDETMSDYTVDHSSFIYFIDPDDNLRRIFKMDDTAEEITEVMGNTL